MEFLSATDIEKMFGSGTVEKAESLNTQEKENNTEDKQETTDEEDKSTQESRSSVESQEEGNTSKDNASDSPNLYSSIAKALVEDGVFPELDITDIKDAASFRKMFETQVDKRLNVQQKRIVEALNYGISPSLIQKCESTLSYLDNINERKLSEETSDGELLRKQIIAQDLINRGYSQEKVKKEVEKSFNAGTDIDDAREALEANKKHYKGVYDSLREKAKQEAEITKKNRQDYYDSIKKGIDEKENAFGSLPLDKETKEKIYKNLMEPVYKAEDGNYYTAIQKYQHEHSTDFLRYLSTFFTLTDGFTDFSKIFKPVAQKAVKKGFSQLEDVLKGNILKDGDLKLMGDTTKGDVFSGSWKIDL